MQSRIDSAVTYMTKAAEVLRNEEVLFQAAMSELCDIDSPSAKAAHSLFDGPRARMQNILWSYQKSIETDKQEAARKAADNDLDSDPIDFAEGTAGFVSHRNDTADNRTKLKGCKGYISVDDTQNIPSVKNGGR